jgi:hypothetical protein
VLFILAFINHQVFAEDAKGVIRFRKSKKNRQHNAKKDTRTQQSTKHTHKTKDWVTQTPPHTGYEVSCSERVSSSCSTSGIQRFNLVTNPVINHAWRTVWKMITTSWTYPWSFVTHIFNKSKVHSVPNDISYRNYIWKRNLSNINV